MKNKLFLFILVFFMTTPPLIGSDKNSVQITENFRYMQSSYNKSLLIQNNLTINYNNLEIGFQLPITFINFKSNYSIKGFYVDNILTSLGYNFSNISSRRNLLKIYSLNNINYGVFNNIDNSFTYNKLSLIGFTYNYAFFLDPLILKGGVGAQLDYDFFYKKLPINRMLSIPIEFEVNFIVNDMISLKSNCSVLIKDSDIGILISNGIDINLLKNLYVSPYCLFISNNSTKYLFSIGVSVSYEFK